MSLLLKAFPHGRPRPHAHRSTPVRALVPSVALATAISLVASFVLVALPLAGSADATRHHAHRHAHHHAKKHAAKKHAAKKHAHQKHATTKAARKAHKKARPPRVPGQPRRNYVIPQGPLFSFPNKNAKSRLAIRNRVLYTVQSVWGGHLDRYHAPLASNGRIRMATWSFDDWRMARALVAAKNRGVSVQIVAAKKANRHNAPWHWLLHKLGSRMFRPGYPNTNYTWSFARQCRGSCRGLFGTAHAKYFLFDNVGAAHARTISVQTSMNLTTFAFTGQWNQADVSHAPSIYEDYYAIFRQARVGRPQTQPYHVRSMGPYVDFFFPRYSVTPALDPVYQILNGVRCTGATAGGTGRTQINVDQYAIYGARGEWLAKRMRYLWEHGCNLAIIYSVASRPVLSILRSGQGRGAIPMRQSVITNGYGVIMKYNHSKWMTIVGNWAGHPDAYLTFTGSANWGPLALGSDEQMQRILGRSEAAAHLVNFAQTWRQGSSHMPGYGVLPNITGRVIPYFARDVPADEPTWGKGVFKYMTPD